MTCPQCGAELPDDGWNCPSCRINLYWASRHHGELARLRACDGASPAPKTPPFLIASSRRALGERAASPAGAAGGNRVREIARREMRRAEPEGDA